MIRNILAAIFALLISCAVANAAPTNLGSNDNAGGGVTSATISPIVNAVSAGVPILVFCNDTNTTTPSVSVTDSKSNTYTPAPSISFAFGLYSFYSFITTPLNTSDTISCTDSAATGFQQIDIGAVSVPGYNAYDSATANSNNNGFTGSFSVTGLGSAAVANEIYFGFSFTNSTFSGTPVGWSTTGTSSPLPGQFLIGWQINSGTSALTWNGTTAGSQNTNSLILSLKPSGAAAVIPGALMQVGPMMGVH